MTEKLETSFCVLKVYCDYFYTSVQELYGPSGLVATGRFVKSLL